MYNNYIDITKDNDVLMEDITPPRPPKRVDDGLERENKLYKDRLNKCLLKVKTITDSLSDCKKLGQREISSINNRLISVSRELESTKNSLESCKRSESSLGTSLKEISKTNVMSYVYILPHVAERSLKMNQSILNIDRFTFDTSNQIAEGSFGAIYSGRVLDPKNNPLSSSSNYVIKIIKETLSQKLISDTSIEMNIQHLIYNLTSKELKTPYIYPKLFVDNLSGRLGFVSQFVKSVDMMSLVSGFTQQGYRLNDGASYNEFKKSVLNPLHTLYTRMKNGDTDISFKHNDLHYGNLMIEMKSDGRLDYKIIDYGLTTLGRVYDMTINETLTTYFPVSKLYIYMMTFYVKPEDMKGEYLVDEFMDYMTLHPLSDYHLYLISTCCYVLETCNIISSSQSIDPSIKSMALHNINNNEWSSYIKDYIRQYSFMAKFTIDTHYIYYNNVRIKIIKGYMNLYRYMRENIRAINSRVLNFQHTLDSEFLLKVISFWDVTTWKILSLFIEVYMPIVDINAYQRCIQPLGL